MPGSQNRYLIRISGNYFWYTDEAAFIRLRPNTNVANLSVRILRGDIDYESMNPLERYTLNQDLQLNALVIGK